MSEDGAEIVWINQSVVIIPPFWVDVPMVSQSIGLCSQLAWLESSNEIELREELGPVSLSTC
jgi:hypothetical protein